MATNALGFLEGQAINRPPLLTGSNYPYWKCRMRIFIKAQNRLLWNVIEKGPYVIAKDEINYTDDDWKKLDMNELVHVKPPKKYGMNWRKHMKELLE